MSSAAVVVVKQIYKLGMALMRLAPLAFSVNKIVQSLDFEAILTSPDVDVAAVHRVFMELVKAVRLYTNGDMSDAITSYLVNLVMETFLVVADRAYPSMVKENKWMVLRVREVLIGLSIIPPIPVSELCVVKTPGDNPFDLEEFDSLWDSQAPENEMVMNDLASVIPLVYASTPNVLFPPLPPGSPSRKKARVMVVSRSPQNSATMACLDVDDDWDSGEED